MRRSAPPRSVAPERLVASGHLESTFRPPDRLRLFDGTQPVLIYASERQRHRSSFLAAPR